MVKPLGITMTTEQTESEKKILEAAKKVFQADGFKGARMQQIADEAGISKASLHYYFRSKEKLFERISEETMKDFMPIVATWDDSTDKWENKIREFIPTFMHFMQTRPMLFILGELNRNPETLLKKKKKGHKAKFISYFERLREEGKIRDIEPVILLTYMHSLCCYPVLNENFFKAYSGLHEKDYKKLMENYPATVAELIINYIKKK